MNTDTGNIELVNGRERRVFRFEAATFIAPISIGAGYRAQIDAAKGMASIDSKECAKDVAAFFEKHPAPKGIPFEAWYKSKTEELTPIVMRSLEVKNAWRSELAALETILTPADGSLDVETWYREHASNAEVQQVMDFIDGTLGGKTETALAPEPSGEGTDAPKAGRSKGTSRRRSAN